MVRSLIKSCFQAHIILDVYVNLKTKNFVSSFPFSRFMECGITLILWRCCQNQAVYSSVWKCFSTCSMPLNPSYWSAYNNSKWLWCARSPCDLVFLKKKSNSTCLKTPVYKFHSLNLSWANLIIVFFHEFLRFVDD